MNELVVRCACGAVYAFPLEPMRPGESRPCSGPRGAPPAAAGDASRVELPDLLPFVDRDVPIETCNVDLGGEG